MELVINSNLNLQQKLYSAFKEFFDSDRPVCKTITIDNVVRRFKSNNHSEYILAEIFVDSQKAGYLKYSLSDDKYEDNVLSKRVYIDPKFYSSMPKNCQIDNSKILFEYF